MNDAQEFEAELASLKPARLPEAFEAELTRKLERTQPDSRPSPPSRPTMTFFLPVWLRWALPAVAVVLVLALLPLHRATSTHSKSGQNAVAAKSASDPSASVLKADAIMISQELVGNFDAVTRLPDGAAVRLRCQEWMDEVQVRDPSRGVWVERRKPRLEIVRVGYETY